MISLKRSLAVLSSCLAIAICAPHVAAAEQAPATVQVGGRDLQIPVPAKGMVRCDGISEEFDKNLNAFLPATNRMIAYFCTEADAEGLKKGENAPMDVSFNIQTMRKLESQEIGSKTFASVRDSMRKEVANMQDELNAKLKQVMEKGNAHIQNEKKLDAALDVSDVAVLGFFDEENSSALGFTTTMNLATKIAGTEEKSRNVVAAYLIPANGRMLLLYAGRPYLNDGDRLVVEREVKAWGDAIIAANPKIEGKAASGGLFRGVGRSGLVGAGIGVAVALIAMILRKRQAA